MKSPRRIPKPPPSSSDTTFVLSLNSTTAQGDDLLLHRDPYLTSAPIPEVKRAQKKKKSKRKSKKGQG